MIVATGTFDIVVTHRIPGASAASFSTRVNRLPLNRDEASRHVHGIMRQIGRGFAGNAVDASIEPRTCTRPWSPETRRMWEREMGRAGVGV